MAKSDRRTTGGCLWRCPLRRRGRALPGRPVPLPRLAGSTAEAPFGAFAIFPAERVSFSGDAPATYASSAHGRRLLPQLRLAGVRPRRGLGRGGIAPGLVRRDRSVRAHLRALDGPPRVLAAGGPGRGPPPRAGPPRPAAERAVSRAGGRRRLPAHRSHARLRVPRAGGRLAGHRLVQGREVARGERQVRRREVLVEVAPALGAGDRHDVLAAGQDPGQRELRRRAAFAPRQRIDPGYCDPPNLFETRSAAGRR